MADILMEIMNFDGVALRLRRVRDFPNEGKLASSCRFAHNIFTQISQKFNNSYTVACEQLAGRSSAARKLIKKYNEVFCNNSAWDCTHRSHTANKAKALLSPPPPLDCKDTQSLHQPVEPLGFRRLLEVHYRLHVLRAQMYLHSWVRAA